MDIQELPDLRQNIEEYYNHDSGGLLDYVWEVANHFIPSYDGEVFQMSQAPAIFCERYHQSRKNHKSYEIQIHNYHQLYCHRLFLRYEVVRNQHQTLFYWEYREFFLPKLNYHPNRF